MNLNAKAKHCRFCGENKEMGNIMDLTKNKKIQEKCEEILNFLKIDFVDFESKVIPKTICEDCFKYLGDIYEFFLKVKTTQTLLNNFYSNSDSTFNIVIIKEEIEDDISNEEFDNKNIIEKDKKIIKPQDFSNLTINNQEIKINSTFTKKTDFNFHNFESEEKIANENNLKNKIATIEQSNQSWTDYNWLCQHCGAKFGTMNEVRDHSKVIHAICFGFKCMDCSEIFNYFNPFIEHVRQHSDNLRLYCEYCNTKHSTAKETISHTITHWNASNICNLCGELLKNINALQRHKKAYKKLVLPQKYYKKKPKKIDCFISWKEYEWICQDCNQPQPDINSLRSHTRELHRKCFSMKCVDCLKVMGNFKQFVEHVSAHRVCLKSYCQICNIYNPNKKQMKEHISSHFLENKICEGCGEMFPDSASLSQHMTLYETPRLRGKKSSESLTCGVCCKAFSSGFQLKNHKVIHDEKRERDQICHLCGKAFYELKNLTIHIKTHFNKTEVCEICQKSFLTKQRLKVHISTHFEAKKFVCNDCGKKFRRKSQLCLHLASHSDVLPFSCGVCSKSFKLLSYLKIHERRHSGIRPYTCEICNNTFNHWGNCNRHMIKKHGVSLAKTKITEHGKVDINRQTGEPNLICISGNAKNWGEEMLKSKKRGRRKK